MEYLTALLFLFSLLGTILNAQKRKVSFIIWGFTSTAWAIYDFSIGAFWQGILFCCYMILSIYGWWKWTKLQ